LREIEIGRKRRRAGRARREENTQMVLPAFSLFSSMDDPFLPSVMDLIFQVSEEIWWS